MGVPEEGTRGGVDLGLAELVEVAEEFEDVGPAEAGEGEWGAVVFEVLAEGVPVPAFLGLVAAEWGWVWWWGLVG